MHIIVRIESLEIVKERLKRVWSILSGALLCFKNESETTAYDQKCLRFFFYSTKIIKVFFVCTVFFRFGKESISGGSNNRRINWLSWEKLSMCKNQGGMGFPNLSTFNLAMPDKQGWKFQTEPQSLVSRIFKAQYFPSLSYLTLH